MPPVFGAFLVESLCPFPIAAVALPSAALPTPTATVAQTLPGVSHEGVNLKLNVGKVRSGFLEMFRRLPSLPKYTSK